MLETKQTIYTEPKKFFVCGLVNFVPAVAYLFYLNLPAAFSQPCTRTFFGLYIEYQMSMSDLSPIRQLRTIAKMMT